MTALILLALALSMDAFAAALGQGTIAHPHSSAREALRIGAAFGLAQASMPLVGWWLGIAFASIIRDVDHWIAFVLLVGIGTRMVYLALSAHDAAPKMPLSGRGLLSLALATSVDAGAAGVTLPLLGPRFSLRAWLSERRHRIVERGCAVGESRGQAGRSARRGGRRGRADGHRYEDPRRTPVLRRLSQTPRDRMLPLVTIALRHDP
ncbi:MAG: manganese efflux pump [Proteobacteria bacterium]|nr:manganese efflux pump [Burkholderiales bacterium]